MKKLNYAINLFAVAQALVLSPVSRAETDSPKSEDCKPHVGIVAGYGDINGSWKGAFQYGLDGGFQIHSPWSLGLQVNYTKADLDTSLAAVSVKRWAILPRVAYNFGGTMVIIKDSYLGLKFGAILDKGEVTAASVTTTGDTMTRFAFAPVVGFDQPLSPHLTVGAEISYLFVMGPELNNDQFSALAAVKYWF